MSDTFTPSSPRGNAKRWVVWAVIWAAVFLMIATIISQSVAYTDCIKARKSGTQYQALHNSQDDIHGALLRRLARARLIGYCLNTFAEENEHSISALAAVALAFFTLYLWLATRGLRRYAGIQMHDMRQLLTAAKNNAAAAVSQADAMEKLRLATEAQENILKEQAKALSEQAEIARRTVTLTLRPRIRVRDVNLGHADDPERDMFAEGHPVEGRFWIVNIGGSTAHVRTWRCHVLIGRIGSPPQWPTKPTTEDELNQQLILGTGVNTELRFQTLDNLTREQAQNLRGLAQSITLYVMGRILYVDDLGVPRNTAFYRYWAMPQGTHLPRFHRFQDPDFEYED